MNGHACAQTRRWLAEILLGQAKSALKVGKVSAAGEEREEDVLRPHSLHHSCRQSLCRTRESRWIRCRKTNKIIQRRRTKSSTSPPGVRAIPRGPTPFDWSVPYALCCLWKMRYRGRACKGRFLCSRRRSAREQSYGTALTVRHACLDSDLVGIWVSS